MKYISVFVLLGLLGLSWRVINRPFDISADTHAQIQGELAQIIENVVRESSPTLSNFRIVRLWTETVNYNRVKAQFIYSYVDQMEGDRVSQTREGRAILNRQTPTPGQRAVDSQWSLDEVQVLNSKLEFESGSSMSREGSINE